MREAGLSWREVVAAEARRGTRRIKAAHAVLVGRNSRLRAIGAHAISKARWPHCQLSR